MKNHIDLRISVRACLLRFYLSFLLLRLAREHTHLLMLRAKNNKG
jgi:hypothetical protein